MRRIIGPARREASSTERVDLRELVVDARAVTPPNHRPLGRLIERVPDERRRVDADMRVRGKTAVEDLRRQLREAVLAEQDDWPVRTEIVEERLVCDELV